MAEELQSVPLPHGTWPWPCDDYTDGVFVAGESPALDAYYAVLDMLETSIETSSLVAWLGAVIAADPDHYDTYLVLRDVLADSGQRAAGIRFEEIAYVRCLSRITMPDGGWPARLTYTELTNRPIMRTLISKAATLWRLKQTDEALDILRRMLKMDPEDRTAAAAHILGMRMGMTQPQFERRFYGEGVEAFVMMDWFGAHYGSFPEEFAERRETVKTEFQEPDWKGQPGEDVADDGGANGDQYQSAAETVN
jgi:tetratricopeptide (TPR) repeat protein